MFSLLKFVSILFSLFLFPQQAQTYNKKLETIKILTWWNYISPSVIKNLKKKNYKIETGIYRSNEVAISRLTRNKEGYDLAIISNPIISVLNKAGHLKKDISRRINKERDYHSFILKDIGPCVPYLWSSTVFIYKNVPKKEQHSDLKNFLNLDRSIYKVGLIDDSLEIFNRAFGDTKKVCNVSLQNQTITNTLKLCKRDLVFNDLNFKKNEFISSDASILKSKKSAFYAWHGIISQAISNLDEIDLVAAKDKPVFGFDAICIVNKDFSQKRLHLISNFLSELTNKTNTAHNMKAFQYFSPYREHKKGLHQKIKNLQSDIESIISKGDGRTIQTTSPEEYSKIQKWWRNVRYK